MSEQVSDKRVCFRCLVAGRVQGVFFRAAAREQGISYNALIHGLSKAQVTLDRKMLAEMALNDPEAFGSLVELALKETKDGA